MALGWTIRAIRGQPWGLLGDSLWSANHYLWRNYSTVTTRCRGTVDPRYDICKSPIRRVAVTSPVT